MCTLSWFATRRGYEAFFNRDERLTRAAERSPSKAKQSGVHYLAPSDGQAGGTWISVNERGLTLALLNAPQRGAAAPRAPASRGALVRQLAGSSALTQVHARMDALALEVYPAFTLLALAVEVEPIVFEWDGAALRVDPRGSGRMPLVSSSVEAVDATAIRADRLDDLAERARGVGLSREALLSFHRSHKNGPSARSTCMHGGLVETRSLAHIVVDERAVSLAHATGSPCHTTLATPLVLPRG